MNHKSLFAANMRLAKKLWPALSARTLRVLGDITHRHGLSVLCGEVVPINERWYVTHVGLLRIAQHRKCRGIHVELLTDLCDPQAARWCAKAMVFTSASSRGFVGHGDADPSNVSPLVHGAEMRVAETRAVNRALRKAYGIGICSLEELGAQRCDQTPQRDLRKLPPENVEKDNNNGNGARLRDRLCQIIRKHELDGELVKAYVADFCGTKTLREATREQIEAFVVHIADWAEKDRNALLCQLNSYVRPQAGAA